MSLMYTLDVNYTKDRVYAISGRDYRNSFLSFKMMPKRKRKKIDLLRGHQFFGAHEYLRNGAVYFTMMRNPFSRLASLYNYLREINLYQEINQDEYTLQQFLDSGLAMAADNGMTRMLTDRDFDKVANGLVDETLAKEAIKNLEEHFCAIGIQEEFDNSVRLFSHKLGWDNLPEKVHRNRTIDKRLDYAQVKDFFGSNPKYLRFIQCDLKVYQYALKRFRQEEIFQTKNE